MKSLNLLMTVLGGLFCLGYDLWLIGSGQFHPMSILVPLACVAVAIGFSRAMSRRSEAAIASH